MRRREKEGNEKMNYEKMTKQELLKELASVEQDLKFANQANRQQEETIKKNREHLQSLANAVTRLSEVNHKLEQETKQWHLESVSFSRIIKIVKATVNSYSFEGEDVIVEGISHPFALKDRAKV